MKTPTQLAEAVIAKDTWREWDYDAVRNAIAEGIEADRAQRDPNEDGTLHGATIIALQERTELDGEDRSEIIAWIEDQPDEFWERFAGHFLDDIEGETS